MYTCNECQREFSRPFDLSKHINCKHDGTKIYYDKWFKTGNIGICKVCGEEAKFRNLIHGYNHVCEKQECLYKFKSDNLQKGMIRKYGKNASILVKEIRDKQEKTNLKKYGAKSPLASEKIRNKIKKTSKERYGTENPLGSDIIKKQIKETNMKKYGVENCSQNKDIRNKVKKTMKERYGVESYLSLEKIKTKNIFKKYGVKYAQQDKDIHIKQQLSSMKLKYFNNTNIHYRGKYELDFLEKYYDKFEILNGITFKYKHKSKNRYYHSDFYIPSLNLIVEIKNSYLAKRDMNILNAKEKSVKNLEYNFIMIIDKNYIEFDKFI